MINPKLIGFADAVLALKVHKDMSISEIATRVNLSEEDVCDVFRYLKEVGAVDFIETFGSNTDLRNLQVTSKGAEVAWDKRNLVESSGKSMTFNGPTNYAETNAPNNIVNQSMTVTTNEVLKEFIERDEELEEDSKGKLLDLLDKFNKIKETGENAHELIRKVRDISVKYVPFFFTLLSNLIN